MPWNSATHFTSAGTSYSLYLLLNVILVYIFCYYLFIYLLPLPLRVIGKNYTIFFLNITIQLLL